MLRALIPYLIAALLGAGVMHLVGTRQLADERAARAVDEQRHAGELAAVSRAALDAEQRAVAAHDLAATRVAAADTRTTKERNRHEAENRSFRDALAAGDQRLRVAVRACAAADAGSLPGASSPSSMGDGAVTYADVDRATAERVFAVADDDQREIDKLRALQAYVCAVRFDTPACRDQQ
jgi:prophage endopeptidase